MRCLSKVLAALSVALVMVLFSALSFAQSPISFRYLYDDISQLSQAIDSTGIKISWIYDEVGNIKEIRRETLPNGLAILGFTPTQGAVGTNVTIQRQSSASSRSRKLNSYSKIFSGPWVPSKSDSPHIIL